VRGIGLFIATRNSFAEGLKKILYNSFKKGTLSIDAEESAVRIEPPLIIKKEELYKKA